MTEVSRNLRNIFFPKIPPILKIEVGFFSSKKSFSKIFQNWEIFFYLNFISKKKKKSENTFCLTSLHFHFHFSTINFASVQGSTLPRRPTPSRMNDDDDDEKKMFSDFFYFFFRNKVQIEKNFPILENLRKTFFYWKKIQLQVSKSGVFSEKKCSAKLLKLRS